MGETLEDLLSPPTDSNFDCDCDGDDDDEDDNGNGYDRMGRWLDSKSVDCDNGRDGDNKNVEGLGEDVSFKWHPFGAFDYNTGYMVSEKWGGKINQPQHNFVSLNVRSVRVVSYPHFCTLYH